jgi:hypothetical protein
MNDAKYIELDVHQATISVAILDSVGTWLWKPFSKRRRKRFCGLFVACVAVCM